MQNNNKWILPLCLLLGAGAFGVAFVVVPKDKKETPPTLFQPAAAANPGNEPVVPAKQEAPDHDNASKQDAAKQDTPKSKEPVKQAPPKQDRPPAPKGQRAAYRAWTVPTTEKLTGSELHTYDVKELTVSHDGTQALTKSGLEVHCLNLVSGRFVQTFKPPKPKWKYNKPNTDCMCIAPDASRVIVASESQTIDNKKRTIDTKEITVYDAANGNVLGRGVLDERTDMHRLKDAAVFTPRGDFLLLPTFDNSAGLLIQAVSSNSGAVRMVNVPGNKLQGHGWELTLAVPQAPTLLVERRGGSVAALDLRSGTEKSIAALTVDPWTLYNRGVHLSQDGNLVLSQGHHELQVCDWRADRRVLELKIGELKQSYNNGQFTPDGKRILVQWKPSFQIIRNGVRETYSRIWLYDIASQKQIAQFTPEEHGLAVEINGLTISRDGKTLVWGNKTNVIAMDFKAAFGIDPLPPIARPTEPDVLPLK